MLLQEQNVLLFSCTMDIGGTENVVLQICKVLKNRVQKIVFCSCGGAYVGRLKEMGIRHYDIPDIENKDFKTVVRVLSSLEKIIKEEQITVIHSHHRQAGFYANIMRIRFRNLRLIATAHGVFKNRRMLTKFSYRMTDVIACGQVVRKNLVDYYGVDDARVSVIHNAVQKNIRPITPVAEIESLSSDRFKVAYIGRISEEKGLEYLLKAIAIVKDVNQNIAFIIAGDGPQREQMESEARKLGVMNNLIFLGYRNDIQNVIKQIDLVVLPSLTEGFPLSLIEAFAQGRPVVSTDVGGCVEIVKNEENGLLVMSRNEYQLADAILRFATDKELYEKCSRKARESYESEYSMDKFNSGIVDFYQVKLGDNR